MRSFHDGSMVISVVARNRVPRLGALGAEGERGGDASAVGDPSGGDDGHVAGDVDDRRDEDHRRHPAAVAAGLVPGQRARRRRRRAPSGRPPHRRRSASTGCHGRGPLIRSGGMPMWNEMAAGAGRGSRRTRPVERPARVVDGERPVGELAAVATGPGARPPSARRCRGCRAAGLQTAAASSTSSHGPNGARTIGTSSNMSHSEELTTSCNSPARAAVMETVRGTHEDAATNANPKRCAGLVTHILDIEKLGDQSG